MKKRMISLALALMMCFSLSVTAFATEENDSIHEIFMEAKAAYNSSSTSYALNNSRKMVYEEIAQPDGSTMIIEGYPTSRNYFELPTDDGYLTDSYVYTLSLNSDDGTEEVWGRLISTLGFYKRDVVIDGADHEQVKIHSLSYEFENLTSGYNFNNVSIRTYSIDERFPENNYDNQANPLLFRQLSATNYSTSSLGWVCRTIKQGFYATGAHYTPTFNGVTYGTFKHCLVD